MSDGQRPEPARQTDLPRQHEPAERLGELLRLWRTGLGGIWERKLLWLALIVFTPAGRVLVSKLAEKLPNESTGTVWNWVPNEIWIDSPGGNGTGLGSIVDSVPKIVVDGVP